MKQQIVETPDDTHVWVKDDAPPSDIRSLLDEREKRYGSFEDFAAVNQGLMSAAICGNSFGDLSDVQRVGVDMIIHKLSRILNGDPSYIDNWVDIAGYAQLVVDSMSKA